MGFHTVAKKQGMKKKILIVQKKWCLASFEHSGKVKIRSHLLLVFLLLAPFCELFENSPTLALDAQNLQQGIVTCIIYSETQNKSSNLKHLYL